MALLWGAILQTASESILRMAHDSASGKLYKEHHLFRTIHKARADKKLVPKNRESDNWWRFQVNRDSRTHKHIKIILEIPDSKAFWTHQSFWEKGVILYLKLIKRRVPKTIDLSTLYVSRGQPESSWLIPAASVWPWPKCWWPPICLSVCLSRSTAHSSSHSSTWTLSWLLPLKPPLNLTFIHSTLTLQ